MKYLALASELHPRLRRSLKTVCGDDGIRTRDAGIKDYLYFDHTNIRNKKAGCKWHGKNAIYIALFLLRRVSCKGLAVLFNASPTPTQS